MVKQVVGGLMVGCAILLFMFLLTCLTFPFNMISFVPLILGYILASWLIKGNKNA